MNGRFFCFTLLIAVCFGSCKNTVSKETVLQEEKHGPRQPNIVFIFADDLGFADLGFTGSDTHLTPNLDKLAKESVYFDRAYAAHPTCAPSRMSIMTGKYPARLGAVSHGKLGGVAHPGPDDNGLPMTETTIGEALKKEGYTTAHIGKWHIGKGENNPGTRGFDVDIASNEFCCPGSYMYPFESNNEKQRVASKIPDLEDRKPGDFLTDALAEEAVKFIHSTDDKPFFLNMSFYAVHTPITAIPEKVEKYKRLIGPDARQKNPTYAGLVEHLDDAVGAILEALEEKGIIDNTIIVFTSDNGGEILNGITDNFPLRDGKGSSYEGGTRVPLLVKWPGVTQANTVSHERIIGFDYYPTFLSMAGASIDLHDIDGRDFSPLLKNPKEKLEERDLHWLKYLSLIHYRIPIADNKRCFETIVSGDWKLHEYFQMPDGYKQHFELYNLKDDPSEKNNLANKFPEKVQELKLKMESWKKDIGAPVYDMEKFYGHIKI
ncbi:sulfatase [Zobellia uliginosa]|uniref:sulfatase n=1 Tax=Zobellia uliginosa TaxID=143224 RepID=UPI0026E1CEA1|nr:sulfatase [Zobellia uliginosa]MDO6519448.1 sulfatase [Zobellia uliginosa]